MARCIEIIFLSLCLPVVHLNSHSQMSSQKKSRLKAVSYSFKGRGSLSQQKDLDVDYMSFKPTTGKRGKRAWRQVQADPLYETSGGHSSSSSPKKRTKEAPMEFPDSGTYDTYRETFGDFVVEAEATQHARKTKVRLTFLSC
jgi:hypothetical protein